MEQGLDTPGARLRWARLRAGYETATAAATARGWKASTYLGHENGDRNPSRTTAKRYARAFRIKWAWLLEGEGDQSIESDPGVPMVGVINPGAKVVFDDDLKRTAPSPPEGAEDAVALLAESTVMPGVIEEGWIVYCQRARRAPAKEDIGRLSVICLASGETLIGRLLRGRGDLYDVVTITFESRQDIGVDWLSTVTWIKPR